MKEQKFKLGKNALFLTIISLLTVMSWVGFEVYEAINKTTIAKVTKEQMAPINPLIKNDVFEKLEKNFSLSEEEMNIVESTPEATPEGEEIGEDLPKETTTSAEANEGQATGSSQTTSENDIVD